MPGQLRRAVTHRGVAAASLTAASVAAAAIGLVLTGPAPWPPGVGAIAAFVAHDRGLDFVHPVPVHFVAPHTFDRRLAAEDAATSAATRRAEHEQAAELRALGLITGRTDLAAAAQASDLSGGVLGYYTDTVGAVYLRGTSLTPPVAVTLAHELTHALQDQHFSLARLAARVRTTGETFALTALEEGGAVLDEDDYEATLRPAARRQVTAQTRPPARPPTPTTTPPFLTVTASAPYVLGAGFADALYSVGGNAALDRAYRRLPKTELDILDPAAYLERLRSRALPPPSLLPGQARDGPAHDFGAFMLYMTLASRLPARRALEAADAWGGGEIAPYRDGGRACFAVDLVGRDAAGSARIGAAVDAWAAGTSDGRGATAAPVSGTAAAGGVRLDTCDPGRSAAVGPGTLEAALTLAAARNSLEDDALARGATAPVAGCAADAGLGDPRLLRAATRATVVGPGAAAARRAVDRGLSPLLASCRRGSGGSPP